MIKGFKSKPLAAFWFDNDGSGIRPDWIKKTKRILDALHSSSSPNEVNMPGFGFHGLRGDRAGIYSVTVSRNWRITFRHKDGDAYDVDLEDYHE